MDRQDRTGRLRSLLLPVAYPLAGLTVGIGPFQELAIWLGVRPGIGVFIVVNLVLPLVAVAFALARPRPAAAAVGGLLLAVGFVLGAMLRREPLCWHWTWGLLKAVTHPILIPAAIGYAAIGAVVSGIVRSLRTVEV